MRRLILILIVLKASAVALLAQNDLKREVTLYNPYKPSLTEVRKKSYLPDINDTTTVRPDFSYNISTRPYYPVYTISTIKAASLIPDPLTKLYKSYINLGFGNYLSPLAEISISSERSKKGAFGFYASHYSTNGKVKLQNEKKTFAGYMDNDLALYGRKFFRKSYLSGSLDFSQNTRYAYGYDTVFTSFDPDKKDIRIGYNNPGVSLQYASMTLDSSVFSYDFKLGYDFFYNTSRLYQHNFNLKGEMATVIKGFYTGLNPGFSYSVLSDDINAGPKYNIYLNPYVTKSTDLWNFRLGFNAMLDRNMTNKPEFHIYPDISFGFSIVPSYLGFFTGLSGRLERNSPSEMLEMNPFIIGDGSLFRLPSTDHSLIVMAGMKGNTGIGGSYLLKASYSIIADMPLFSNFSFPDTLFNPEYGNRFIPFTDDAEVLEINGSMNGIITSRLSYSGEASWYHYTMSESLYAWNRPDWEARLNLNYNLRDKIIASAGFISSGSRKLLASRINDFPPATDFIFTTPVHFGMNLGVEYRYTKILSFWFRMNNISARPYYEWAYYPSQRFMGMLGFTYSL
jgi:hypothetical protein